MQKYETQIVVIGGGATGTGILRDLALRGFDAILVEKNDLSTGTTGRYHGLLHSGGRYVVRDAETAKECIEENKILRRILPNCIEDTGGFFVQTHLDDPEYAQDFIEGCHKAGISVEEIKIKTMLKEEPLLNPKIQRCFRVPDASADSFMASRINVQSAISYGAKLLRYHKVNQLIVKDHHVVGVICEDILNNSEVEIRSEIVINASGAWAGNIAKLAGIEVHVIPGKGSMIAMNHRIVNTVINRCKYPSDGDILVPAHTVSVMGTTDIPVSDPDHFAIDPWEVHLLLEEGDILIPGFRDMRMLRAWAGVRPLYQEKEVDDTRDVTRSFVLLDHESRDDMGGFITITSGKWTTYRKMAEVTVDLVCEKLGEERECRTHLEALPDAEKHGYHYLGSRLEKIEKEKLMGTLICECELITYEDIKKSISEENAKSIDDIRRSTRVGMGPCQGGFCTYRVAGIFHKIRRTPIEQTNLYLYDFLQERWKGLLPILWGQQLRQERLDELIYLSILNTDHLPGTKSSVISPISYNESTNSSKEEKIFAQTRSEPYPANQNSSIGKTYDVLVIGAGLAGLSAAWAAAADGKKTSLISKGQGALYWHTGCIDILGYTNDNKIINEPFQALETLIKKQPNHPYAIVGLDRINEAINQFKDICIKEDYPIQGSLESNWLLPSSLGAKRPTCLAPETMIAGNMNLSDPMWIIGFEGYYDFYPEMIADNITNQGIPAKGIYVNIKSLSDVRNINTILLANKFENTEFRQEVVLAIKNALGRESEILPKRIGFPAILGTKNARHICEDLRDNLGVPVFEIPTLPPSIAGIRLSHLLNIRIEKMGGNINIGLEALCSDLELEKPENRNVIKTVWSEAAARRKPHRANKIILATGGILGGGLYAHYNGEITENVFNLPISSSGNHKEWFQRHFLSNKSHPIFQSGIKVDHNLQPIDESGKIILNNLYIAGTTIAGFDYLRERSYDGIALASGYILGKNIRK